MGTPLNTAELKRNTLGGNAPLRGEGKQLWLQFSIMSSLRFLQTLDRVEN